MISDYQKSIGLDGEYGLGLELDLRLDFDPPEIDLGYQKSISD